MPGFGSRVVQLVRAGAGITVTGTDERPIVGAAGGGATPALLARHVSTAVGEYTLDDTHALTAVDAVNLAFSFASPTGKALVTLSGILGLETIDGREAYVYWGILSDIGVAGAPVAVFHKPTLDSVPTDAARQRLGAGVELTGLGAGVATVQWAEFNTNVVGHVHVALNKQQLVMEAWVLP